MRRPETALLHGPWPDPTPDPDDEALDALKRDFGTQWRIWRALTPQRTPAEWCARRIHAEGALRGLSSATAKELRAALEEAER